MIDTVMGFLLGELNGFLGAAFPSNEARAVLSGLVNPDGQTPAGIDNRVVLSLVNIERETAAGLQGGNGGTVSGSTVRTPPPLNLNLYLLVSSGFSAYEVGLRFLSASIGFFNAKSVFTPQNSQAFPRGLDRLSIEMVNLSVQDLQNLWAAVGGKYAPSALYKARMVTILDGWVMEKTPVITGVDTKV